MILFADVKRMEVLLTLLPLFPARIAGKFLAKIVALTFSRDTKPHWEMSNSTNCPLIRLLIALSNPQKF